MPSEQTTQIPQVESFTISEQELQKPVVGKLLHKQNVELQTQLSQLKTELDRERSSKEQALSRFHEADTDKCILNERVSTLGHRNSISQLLWGMIGIALGIAIDAGKSGQRTTLALTVVIIVMAAIANYFVHCTGAPGTPRNE